MKLGIIASLSAAHQMSAATALVAGMTDGDTAEIFHGPDFMARADIDAVAVWGWRQGSAMRDLGFNVLVMERAYLRDRFKWTSLGWNGLNGRARWPALDDSSRWQTHFADLMQPWRVREGGHALLLGQVPSDAACRGVHLEQWLADIAVRLRTRFRQVTFRPHPKAPGVRVPHAQLSVGTTLAEDLAGAAIAVTFNSNSGVDAVLAGVPTVAYDAGSMAWAVTSHSVDADPVTPDRTLWAHSMAWRQWLPEEIAAGLAWPHIKAALNG